MTVRLTVVGFAALMLVPSLADAQGLTWHYEPESLVGMPAVTRAPRQHLAQQYDPPSLPPEIMVPERLPVRRGPAAPPIIVVPPDPLPPEPTSTEPAPAPTPTVPVESNPLIEWCRLEANAKVPMCRTSVHLQCNDDTLRPIGLAGLAYKTAQAQPLPYPKPQRQQYAGSGGGAC